MTSTIEIPSQEKNLCYSRIQNAAKLVENILTSSKKYLQNLFHCVLHLSAFRCLRTLYHHIDPYLYWWKESKLLNSRNYVNWAVVSCDAVEIFHL